MDEPNYQLTDANGTVIGEIGATSGGAVVVEHSSGEQAVLDGDGLTVPAVNTEVLDNGVAGDGNSITSVFGNTGEFRKVAVIPILPGSYHTVDSDTYTRVGNGGLAENINIVRDTFGNLTNVESDPYLQVTGYHDSGNTVRTRVLGITETQVETDSGQTIQSPIGQWDGAGSAAVYIQSKVLDSGDTAQIGNLAIHVYEKIDGSGN